MPKELIIHAGWHKTGSTAIQEWCVRNADLLGQHGILYPTGPDLMWGGHHKMAWALGVAHPFADPKFDAAAFLRDQLQRADKTLLLSSEDFEFLPEKGIRQLRELTGGLTVRIIAFARNVIDYLLADYQQNVRMAAVCYPHDIYRFAFQFDAYTRMNYFALTQKWVRHFGQGAVELHRYSRREGSVIQSFKTVLGHPDLASLDDKANANPSLSAVSVRVLQEFNAMGIEAGRPQIIRHLYQTETSHDHQYCLLEPDLAATFLHRLRPQILRLSQDFDIDAEALLVNSTLGKKPVEQSDWRDRYDRILSQANRAGPVAGLATWV